MLDERILKNLISLKHYPEFDVFFNLLQEMRKDALNGLANARKDDLIWHFQGRYKVLDDLIRMVENAGK